MFLIHLESFGYDDRAGMRGTSALYVLPAYQVGRQLRQVGGIYLITYQPSHVLPF